MSSIRPYDRYTAVEYAHYWAYGRNPAFYNFERLGGDCTNFASQCLYAGAQVMNYTPTFGWYYISANDRAPAWTGVSYFYNFLVRSVETPGPYGVEVPIEQLEPGDFVQLRLGEDQGFQHNPIVVSIGQYPSPENVLLASHSQDSDYRPLNTYPYSAARFLHVLNVRV